jgi:hypothetical protein
MSTRCKCCNRKLFDSEMSVVNELTGDIEDMCNVCKTHAYSEYDYFNDHEYVLGDLKEGLTQVFSGNY